MTDTRGVLQWQLGITWGLWEYHGARLVEAECHWEPGQPCWDVRRTGRGWFADWVEPEPDCPVVVTVGWLTWHIGMWWTQTLAGVADRPLPRPEDIEWPGSLDTAAEWLEDLHGQWMRALDTAELERPARWSPWDGRRSVLDVAGWVNIELMKNIAEIGSVHHLYAVRESR